jgi:hypothetical protein
VKDTRAGGESELMLNLTRAAQPGWQALQMKPYDLSSPAVCLSFSVSFVMSDEVRSDMLLPSGTEERLRRPVCAAHGTFQSTKSYPTPDGMPVCAACNPTSRFGQKRTSVVDSVDYEKCTECLSATLVPLAAGTEVRAR